MLPYGPLPPETIHLCVDMQRVFAEDTPWHTPWMPRVLPVVRRIAEAHPEQTIFTRFLPPHRPDQAGGAWRRYYERWRELTLDHVDPAIFDLLDPLRALVPPAASIAKPTYSPWGTPEFDALMQARKPPTLVITGAETDVCVLASVFGAMDRGYRIVLPVDALCSSSDESHDALLMLYRQRFSQQVETAETNELLAAWP